MAGRDTNIGAKRARETRAALGLPEDAAAPCVLTAVERDLELAVVVAALHEGVAGCCWRDGERVVLWVNGTQAVVRQRFTLAHELGHVRCGHAGAVAVDTYETLAGMTTDSREVQANAFAAELLAPAAGVRATVAGREPSLDDVVRIAARYGISAIAAVYRLDTLAVVPSCRRAQARGRGGARRGGLGAARAGGRRRHVGGVVAGRSAAPVTGAGGRRVGGGGRRARRGG